MKIGLYAQGVHDLLLEIARHVYIEKEQQPIISKECLCHSEKIDGLDVVIMHPEYDNKTGCWTRIKELIEQNLNTQFYLMADTASEREDFFGTLYNLFYIGMNFSTNTKQISARDFYKNPLKIIQENRK